MYYAYNNSSLEGKKKNKKKFRQNSEIKYPYLIFWIIDY